MDRKLTIPDLPILGQPPITSIYDETGTRESHYATSGPYSCGMCIHRTDSRDPFCVHPKVVGDSELQDRLVTIDGRPTIRVDLVHGCCAYVRGANGMEKS